VITSGLGAQGADLLASCRRHGMRLVGPNCFGIAVPGIGLDATFTKSQPTAGIAGLVVQSGGIGISLLDHLSRLGVGVSSFASVGDKYDVSSNDMLTWWEQDGQTRLAVLYVESFGSPRKFGRTARRVGNRMPVLTVIGGRSAAGQRAAASHTAAVATPLVTQEALFAQAGVIAVTGLGELVETIALLAGQPLPAGNRVAIVSNAGGADVLAADACGDNGLQVAVLSSATRRKLTRLLPAGAVVTGPVNTTAAVSEAAFRGCLEEVSADQEVDALLVVAVPTALADLRKAVSAAAVGKPLVACLLDQQETVTLLPQQTAGSGQPAAPAPSPAAADSRPGGGRTVPVYPYPEGAARALGHAARYRGWREQPPGQIPYLGGVRATDARAQIGRFLASHPGGGWLPLAAVSELLQCYQITLVDTKLAEDEPAAVAAAAGLGGPAVLKADVPRLVHKTEAGAVKLYLRDGEEVRAAYRELSATFGPDLTGVLVQPMLTGGVEVLIGVVQEEVFGPLVVFGLGGVATEVLGDHTAKLTPLTDVDADELIRGVHAAPLLFGHRGSPPVDLSSRPARAPMPWTPGSGSARPSHGTPSCGGCADPAPPGKEDEDGSRSRGAPAPHRGRGGWIPLIPGGTALGGQAGPAHGRHRGRRHRLAVPGYRQLRLGTGLGDRRPRLRVGRQAHPGGGDRQPRRGGGRRAGPATGGAGAGGAGAAGRGGGRGSAGGRQPGPWRVRRCAARLGQPALRASRVLPGGGHPWAGEGR